MSTRFLMLSTIALFAAGWLVGCQPDAGNGGMVQIGSTKASLFGPPAEFRAMHPRLEDLLASRIVFRAQPDGEAIAQQLEQGNIQYAFMSGGEYCSVKNPEKITLLASGVNELGKTSRKAFIVMKAGSHVKQISDCKQKRFAFGTHNDFLTDIAAQAALEKAGLPVKELLPELLLPPPAAFEGRLFMQDKTATTIVFDVTVNAGIIGEVRYNKLPESGGNLITGPSKDQLAIVGETIAVPELVVVAGPAAEPEQTAKLKDFLINQVKLDKNIATQLGASAFAEPDERACTEARQLLAGPA